MFGAGGRETADVKKAMSFPSESVFGQSKDMSNESPLASIMKCIQAQPHETFAPFTLRIKGQLAKSR